MPSTHSKELYKFLALKTLADIDHLREQTVVHFTSKTDLHDAFNSLTQNKVLSAPVYDEEAQKWIGLIDMKDFVAYILYLFGKDKQSFDPSSGLATYSVELVDFSKKNPFVPVEEDAVLGHVIKKFCDLQLHRMPVVAKWDHTKIVAMVSQSTIVQYLADHADQLGPEVFKSIEELHVGALGTVKSVLKVTNDTITLEAFQLLNDNRVTGCAVVDEQGSIVGNISITDLQYTVSNDLHYLQKPVIDLIKNHDLRPPITCNKSQSLVEIMRKVSEEKIHRIYVVEDNQPIGIITLTDILDTIRLLSIGSDTW